VINIVFNQNVTVPSEIGGESKRMLVALSELDVKRDVLDLEFVLNSDENPEDIKYYLSIVEWTP